MSCTPDEAIRELTRLRVGCVPREMSTDELTMQTADYARLATRFPAQAVRAAVDDCLSSGDFFPTRFRWQTALDAAMAAKQPPRPALLAPELQITAPRVRRSAERWWLEGEAGQAALRARVAHSMLVAWRASGSTHAPDLAAVRVAIERKAESDAIEARVRARPDDYLIAGALVRLRRTMAANEDALAREHLRSERADEQRDDVAA